MRNAQRDLGSNITLSRIVRVGCIAVVAIGLLAASNAQAFSWGSWNSDYDESEQHSSYSYDSIFDGRSYRTSSGGSYDLSSLIKKIDIDWDKVTSYVQNWVDKNLGDYSHDWDWKDEPRGSTPVPEPAAALLFAIGVGVVATRRRF